MTRVSQKNRIQNQFELYKESTPDATLSQSSVITSFGNMPEVQLIPQTTEEMQDLPSGPAQSSSYYIISSLRAKKKAKKYFLHNFSLAPQVSCFA